MGIFDFRRKTGSDLSVTTLEEPVPVYRANSEIWAKGNGNKPICRICQGSSSSVNQLISPCNCKGTLAYVHFTCLERWLNSSSRINCELCHYQYDTQRTRRYTLWESLRLWLRHPVNWRHLQADLFILTLLSIVTVVLVLMCVLSLEYFIREGKKYGVSQVWTKGALNVFLTIVIVGYAGSMVFLIKEQLTPWYYWWTNTHNIQLRIDCNLSCIESRKKLFEELTLGDYDSAESLPREVSENFSVVLVRLESLSQSATERRDKTCKEWEGLRNLLQLVYLLPANQNFQKDLELPSSHIEGFQGQMSFETLPRAALKNNYGAYF